VEEQYTVLVACERRVTNSRGEESTKVARRQDHRTRQLGQILVRGAAVVLVHEVAAAKAEGVS